MIGEPPALGIDFGTTNSAMAWYNTSTKLAETILNAEGEAKTPSLVYYGDKEVLVGQPVVDLLEDSEHYDEEERAEVTQRVVRSIKRNLLSPPLIPIPGREEPVRPVEVVAQILRKLKHDAQEGHFHEEVERAVISYPAVFDSHQRRVLFDAASMAGFKMVDLVEEPVAAAMAFAHMGQRVGKSVLVYDLGGGTFDLALVARDEEEEDSFYVALEPEGDPRCGGDDFDRALYDHCDRVAQEVLGRSVNSQGSLNPYFLAECRRQKERLSYREKTTVRDYLDGALFKTDIERETFEGLISGEVEKTARQTVRIAGRAREEGIEADTVVLIGGSSQVPLVARRLEETLGLEPRRFANKDYAVALGAAYYAGILELPPRERYRRALSISWDDGRLNRQEVEHLSGLKEELDLSEEVTLEVEREVLGEIVEDLLSKQREEYQEAVEEIRERLKALETQASELGISEDEATGIERELLEGFSAAPTSRAEQREMPENQKTIEDFIPYRVLYGHAGGISKIDIGAGGRILVSFSAFDQYINVHDLTTGQSLHLNQQQLVDNGDWPHFTNIAISPTERLIATQSQEKYGTIELYDPASAKLLRTVSCPDFVNNVTFSPDGRWLALCRYLDQPISLLDLYSGRELGVFDVSGNSEGTVFSPDNQILAAGVAGEIRLWSTQTMQPLRTFDHGYKSSSTDYLAFSYLAFSSDGRFLVGGGSSDGAVRLWDVGTGQLLHSFHSPAEPLSECSAITISPDDRYLAVGGRGKRHDEQYYGVVRLWNLRSKQLIGDLLYSDEFTVGKLATFSRGGQILATTGHNDLNVKVWKRSSGTVASGTRT